MSTVIVTEPSRRIELPAEVFDRLFQVSTSNPKRTVLYHEGVRKPRYVAVRRP